MRRQPSIENVRFSSREYPGGWNGWTYAFVAGLALPDTSVGALDSDLTAEGARVPRNSQHVFFPSNLLFNALTWRAAGFRSS